MRVQAFLLMILAVAICGYAQEPEFKPAEPFIRAYLTASLGIVISGQTSVMSGGPLMAQATLPLRFQHKSPLVRKSYGGSRV